MTKEKFKDKILNAGLKNTKHRLEVIEIISKSDNLLSAQDIYLKLVNHEFKINLSTVYRTLEKLVESKIINRINLENEKQALYEYNKEEHHHFLICKICNKVIPVYTCPIDDYEAELTKSSGFEITDHRIEFYGICEDCKKKQSS